MWWPDGDGGRGIVCSDLGERDRQKRYGQAAVPLAFLEPTFPTYSENPEMQSYGYGRQNEVHCLLEWTLPHLGARVTLEPKLFEVTRACC